MLCFKQLAATANFSLFFVNLLPAFPLDGGRLLLCLLTKPLGRKKASIITRSVGVFLSLSLLGLFAYSCFTTVNFSLAFFAAFLLFGAIEKRPDDRYIRLIDQLSAENVRKARTIKRLAVKQGFTVKDLYAAMDGASLYEVEIYSQGGKLLRTDPGRVHSLTGKNGGPQKRKRMGRLRFLFAERETGPAGYTPQRAGRQAEPL